MSSANIADSSLPHFKKAQTHYWAFLPSELAPHNAGQTLMLDATCWPEKWHHWTRVSRARVGETVSIIDQFQGQLLHAEFRSFSKNHCELLIDRVEAIKHTHFPTLAYVPFIKPDRWEWLLEKLTELGVSDIVPIETRFSQHSDSDTPKARARWDRIVLAAAEQSEQWKLPKLHSSIKLAELKNDPKLNSETQRLVPCERLALSEQELKNPVIRNGPIAFAIGPEGGWHPDELAQLVEMNFSPYRLGPHILRVETAAIAMASLVHEHRD